MLLYFCDSFFQKRKERTKEEVVMRQRASTVTDVYSGRVQTDCAAAAIQGGARQEAPPSSSDQPTRIALNSTFDVIQQSIKRLEEGLQVTRKENEELTNTITTRNREYIKREEYLCGEIARLHKEATERERSGPTVEEQQRLMERTRRALQLQEDITTAEEALKFRSAEATYSTTALERLSTHVEVIEARAAESCRVVTEKVEPILLGILSTSQQRRRSFMAQLTQLTDANFNLSDDHAASMDREDALAVPLSVSHAVEQRCKGMEGASSCAHTIELLKGAEGLLWGVRGLASALTDESVADAERFSRLEDAHVHAKQQLADQTDLLNETQGALLAVHSEVKEGKQRLKSYEQQLAALEKEVQSARASDERGQASSSATPSLQAYETQLSAVESQISALSIELAAEAERLTLLKTECQLAQSREQQEAKTAEEAHDHLEAKKQIMREAEKDKSQLARRLFQLEEAKATADRARTKAEAYLADTDEELRAAELKLKQLELDMETSSQQLRHAHTDLEMKSAQREAMESRRAAKEAERSSLEQRLLGMRDERTRLRQVTIRQQQQLTALAQQEQEALRELQYIVLLLPNNHPCATALRDKLMARANDLLPSAAPGEDAAQGRTMSQGVTSPENLRSIALSRREELLDSARKALRRDDQKQPPTRNVESKAVAAEERDKQSNTMRTDTAASVDARSEEALASRLASMLQRLSNGAGEDSRRQHTAAHRPDDETAAAKPSSLRQSESDDEAFQPAIAEDFSDAFDFRNGLYQRHRQAATTPPPPHPLMGSGGALMSQRHHDTSSLSMSIPSSRVPSDYNEAVASIVTANQPLRNQTRIRDFDDTALQQRIGRGGNQIQQLTEKQSKLDGMSGGWDEMPLPPFLAAGLDAQSSVGSTRRADDDFRQPSASSELPARGPPAGGDDKKVMDYFGRSPSMTSSSTHTSSIAEINEKLNRIMNKRR